ncbi:glycosyl hydrolase [Microbacterium betulae]|uniref:Glycosyl hydrolase n=1 Tax=Microbacterium betulae TaxID=2981139 RepID=A0AA97FGT2_9MICO|nr:glycosyl hydrolase [Microbacterium sp. AB]WOF22234.1 glycosyl hydrolase [Microbacterium sp. AB]
MTGVAADIVRAVREPAPHAAPLMRWWWFSSHVSEAAIDADLDAMRDAGIGGVEVAFVYPVADGGPGFGSRELLALVAYAARGAERRGLRFDLTLGAGWPFGGPHVDAATAARGLHWERIELAPGVTGIAYRPPFDGDVVVSAYVGAGSLQETPASWEPAEVGDRIRVPAFGDGPRVLLIAVSRLTGQNVKRAPRGGEGLVLDHYSAVAARAHLDAVAAPLLEAAGAARVHAGFCDSFEVYDADWTPDLPEEFRARRGYDVLPSLWMLRVDAPGGSRIRADLMTTLSELFEERFLAVFAEWAHAHGILFRAQCYGEPPMLTSSFRHVDLFEGEGWGWRRWTKNSWAVSAASAYGRTIVSSETWTWVRSPSFRAGPLDLLGEAYEHLLGGVNLLFGHGWPVGAALGAGEPVFYASGALDARNPWWSVARELFDGIARASAVLQLGRRIAQVGVYHPVAELRARAEGERPFDLWRQTRRFVDDAFVSAVRTSGLDHDLVDDASLAAGGTERFEVVLVPAGCTPTPRADALLTASGVRVVRLTEPAGEARDAEIRAALAPVVPPLATSRPETVGVTTRQLDDARVSLIVNTAATAEEVVLEATGRALTVWDAVSGRVRAVSADGPAIVRLGSYDGVLVAQADAVLEMGTDARAVAPGPRPALDVSGWSVVSPGGRRSVALPHVWEDDPAVAPETERLVYETDVTLDRAGDVVVDFGEGIIAPRAGRASSFAVPADPPVAVVAHVDVDGTPVGDVWRPPFSIGLGRLTAGRHVLTIAVSSLGVRAAAAAAVDGSDAAAIAADGVRFRVQDAERRAVGVRSGILRAPSFRLSER